MKRICENAGIPQHVTNQNLKTTDATRLFKANVDEQLTMERIGHRSVTGVRANKRTADIWNNVLQCWTVNSCAKGNRIPRDNILSRNLITVSMFSSVTIYMYNSWN